MSINLNFYEDRLGDKNLNNINENNTNNEKNINSNINNINNINNDNNNNTNNESIKNSLNPFIISTLSTELDSTIKKINDLNNHLDYLMFNNNNQFLKKIIYNDDDEIMNENNLNDQNDSNIYKKNSYFYDLNIIDNIQILDFCITHFKKSKYHFLNLEDEKDIFTNIFVIFKKYNYKTFTILNVLYNIIFKYVNEINLDMFKLNDDEYENIIDSIINSDNDFRITHFIITKMIYMSMTTNNNEFKKKINYDLYMLYSKMIKFVNNIQTISL